MSSVCIIYCMGLTSEHHNAIVILGTLRTSLKLALKLSLALFLLVRVVERVLRAHWLNECVAVEEDALVEAENLDDFSSDCGFADAWEAVDVD